MATKLLNDIKIKKSNPTEKEFVLSDGEGLYLRVRPSGAKDWLFIYTFDGKRRKMGLGSLDTVSLATARSEAEKARNSLAQSTDPQLRRQQLEAEQSAQRAALKARKTVEELFADWERRELNERKDKGAEVRRSFEKDVLPTLGKVAIEDVNRTMIVKVLDNVVDRGARIVARNMLGDLRQMFGYAVLRGVVDSDPTSHLKRNDFGKKVERERVLTADEIKMLPTKLEAGRIAKSSTAAIWIMMSTCCRVGEISRAEWKHVDLDAATWVIPADNAKNAKAHTVYLSPFAAAHFRALQILSDDSPWVMPARWESDKSPGHVCVKSITKQVGDRQRGDKEPMKCRSLHTKALILPGGKWTPHDLRRTGATMMGRIGVRPDVIEKCLNHVEQNRLIRVYQHQKLEAEQAEAWRLLGERLDLLLRTDTDTDNVTLLHRAA